MDTQLTNPISPLENYLRGLNAQQTSLEVKRNDCAELTVLENGVILNCNDKGSKLFGYSSERLVWNNISFLVPQLADISLILDEKINPYLRFLTIAKHHFEVIDSNGRCIPCELLFKLVDDFGKCCLNITFTRVGQVR